MNKYLKLFETESEFIRCLDAKIKGDNEIMKFPNVSVIGEEDSNGNFSASEIHYIKDLTKAQAIFDDYNNSGSGSGSGSGDGYEDYSY